MPILQNHKKREAGGRKFRIVRVIYYYMTNESFCHLWSVNPHAMHVIS